VPEQPTIAVTGTGVASGSPDQCRIHVSLNHFAETAADALVVTADIATKAIAALADIQIEQCEVRTVGLSVQDYFDQAQQKVTAHIGSYQLDLVVRPIDEAGGVLASLSSTVGDALQIRGITLTIEDPEPLRSQARRLAIQDAKKRAAEISDEVGVRLGPILSIQDETAGPVNFVQRARPMSGHVGAAANVPIEAGNVSASSAITLIYAIEE
jgi:uncharacterized protein YggE